MICLLINFDILLFYLLSDLQIDWSIKYDKFIFVEYHKIQASEACVNDYISVEIINFFSHNEFLALPVLIKDLED